MISTTCNQFQTLYAIVVDNISQAQLTLVQTLMETILTACVDMALTIKVWMQKSLFGGYSPCWIIYQHCIEHIQTDFLHAWNMVLQVRSRPLRERRFEVWECADTGPILFGRGTQDSANRQLITCQGGLDRTGKS